jgi:hypothetical protein
MPTYYPASTMVQHYHDPSTGELLSGGFLSALIAGTSTPTPMYSSAAGAASDTEIELNSAGEPQFSGVASVIYLDPAVTYDFVLEKADRSARWTIEDITATDGSLITFDGSINYVAPSLGYNLKYARPAVMMIRVSTGSFKVFKPTGVEVDISASATDGLQEAINEACTNGWDLYVAGGGVTTAGVYQTAITCTTGLVFPPMQTRNITIGSVSIEFSAAVTGDGVLIDSCMMVHTRWEGQIVYRGNTTPMRFKTNTAVPLDAVKVIDASIFHLPVIACVGGTNPDGVIFESVNGAIQRCQFIFPENNGADFSTVYGRHGFVVKDPSGAGSGFIGNTITCKALHKYSASSVKVGETTGAAATVYGNTWNLNIMPDGVSSIGVQTYAGNDEFNLAVMNNEGTTATGIQLETSAVKNTFNVLKNDATTPVTDNSTAKNNTGMYGNFLPRASVHPNGTNQTGIVTATWTKVTFSTELYDHGACFASSQWVPGKIGVGVVKARVSWDTMADTSPMKIAVYKNGVIYKSHMESSSGTAGGQGPMGDWDVEVTAVTDYFEIFARQESGGNRDINGTAIDTWAMFEMLP